MTACAGGICLVVRKAMLGAQLGMGGAQRYVKLRNAQVSHQSDTLSEKCEWQRVAASEEGVTTAFRRHIR